MTTRRILELRHVECEGPAAYLPVLKEYAEVVTVRLWKEPVPSDLDFVAIVVMGGPMGANDGGTIPWIDEEIDYLRSAVDASVPVWGVCLGAQLLAAALGARVYTGAVPEVGVGRVDLTGRGVVDPVWGGLPTAFRALQWHSDTFDVPDGAELLASSTDYPNQMFRYGSSYAIQFHLEVDAELAQQWLQIEEYRQSLEQSRGTDVVSGFLEETRRNESETIGYARGAIRRWLDLYVLHTS